MGKHLQTCVCRLVAFYYRPHPKVDLRLCFHSRLSVHICGGYPIWLMGAPHPRSGQGVPSTQVRSQIRMGGTPSPVRMEGGALGYSTYQGQVSGQDRGYPGVSPTHSGQVPGQDGGTQEYPPHGSRTGWEYPHQDLMGIPPSPSGGKAAQRALATRWAVCLLHSRRGTFLYFLEILFRPLFLFLPLQNNILLS